LIEILAKSSLPLAILIWRKSNLRRQLLIHHYFLNMVSPQRKTILATINITSFVISLTGGYGNNNAAADALWWQTCQFTAYLELVTQAGVTGGIVESNGWWKIPELGTNHRTAACEVINESFHPPFHCMQSIQPTPLIENHYAFNRKRNHPLIRQQHLSCGFKLTESILDHDECSVFDEIMLHFQWSPPQCFQQHLPGKGSASSSYLLLHPYDFVVYPTGSKLLVRDSLKHHIILSQEGARQESALGTLLFCLAMHDMLIDAKKSRKAMLWLMNPRIKYPIERRG